MQVLSTALQPAPDGSLAGLPLDVLASKRCSTGSLSQQKHCSAGYPVSKCDLAWQALPPAPADETGHHPETSQDAPQDRPFDCEMWYACHFQDPD